MDIYEMFNAARDNLKIRFGRTEKEVKDGEFFNMVVEVSNPKRPIFPFVREPSYAYKDLVLKVRETAYTRPTDPEFIEGYRLKALDPSDKATVTIPLEAKMDVPKGIPPENILKVIVEAQLRTDEIFGFGKVSEGGMDIFPQP